MIEDNIVLPKNYIDRGSWETSRPIHHLDKQLGFSISYQRGPKWAQNIGIVAFNSMGEHFDLSTQQIGMLLW